MTRLLIATTNLHKIREIRSILAGLPIGLETLEAFPSLAAPPETGRTFAENARDKAIYYARRTGLIAVADDSGLEIEALGGAPGVQSARFVRDSATYEERFAEIHRRLAARSLMNAPARFVCELAVARADTIVFEARGVVDGRIAPEPRGAGGFGYDPIFYYPPYARTLAEVSLDAKTAVSHRGQAFRQLREFLCSTEL